MSDPVVLMSRVHWLERSLQLDRHQLIHERIEPPSLIQIDFKNLFSPISSLTDQPKSEISDMSARLLLNLGVTFECKGDYAKAVKYMEQAMTICRSSDFWDLLQQCYTTTGLLYANKMNDNTTALRFLNLAINTAERLSTNRSVRVCQALQSKSEVLIKMADFQGAKQILHKAYKLKTTDISDRRAIEKSLKIGKIDLGTSRWIPNLFELY